MDRRAFLKAVGLALVSPYLPEYQGLTKTEILDQKVVDSLTKRLKKVLEIGDERTSSIETYFLGLSTEETDYGH